MDGGLAVTKLRQGAWTQKQGKTYHSCYLSLSQREDLTNWPSTTQTSYTIARVRQNCTLIEVLPMKWLERGSPLLRVCQLAGDFHHSYTGAMP